MLLLWIRSRQAGFEPDRRLLQLSAKIDKQLDELLGDEGEEGGEDVSYTSSLFVVG